jgi:medium-chain acyl-[acyl-carrier-protein] hydrolase
MRCIFLKSGSNNHHKTMRHNADTDWLKIFYRRPNASLRLFCFPYAGGGASVFYKWSDNLPLFLEVCPVQLPGRENRIGEAPIDQLNDLMMAIRQNLLLYLNKPFVFYGHSSGALLAYEIARTLYSCDGLQPEHLFVSGRPSPSEGPTKNPIHKLPDNDFLREVQLYNGIPREILDNSELLELLLPALRADFTINETYEWPNGELLSCPISSYGGHEDNTVSMDSLKKWHKLTDGPFDMKMFPGDHFFIRTAEPMLLHALSKELIRYK